MHEKTISSYISSYKNQGTPEKRLAFAVNQPRNDKAIEARAAIENMDSDGFLGRGHWYRGITRLWREARLNSKVDSLFISASLDPSSIMSAMRSREIVECTYAIDRMKSPVAEMLFDKDAYVGDTAMMKSQVWKFAAVVCYKAWQRMRTQVKRSLNKIDDLEQQTNDVIEQLETTTEPFSKAQLLKASRLVGHYRSAVQMSRDVHSLQNVDKKLDWLKAAMARISGDKKRIAATSGVSKITRKMVSDLATDADVQALLAEYETMMEESAPEADPQAPNRPADPEMKSVYAGMGDLGVGHQSRMSTEELQRQLGIAQYPKKAFPVFMTKRHPEFKTAWTHPKLFETDSPDLEDLALKWHQLGGIHAMVQLGFSGKGTLLTDGVGIGKTAQLMGLMAFMMTQIQQKEEGKATLQGVSLSATWADVVTDPSGRQPAVRTQRPLRSLPHLIVVPPNLVPQWNSELRTWYIAHGVDILEYSTNEQKREVFWGSPGKPGVWDECLHKPHHRIIICSHSSLKTEYQRCFDVTAEGLEAWQRRPMRKNIDINTSLFGLNFSTVTVDEAHLFRNQYHPVLSLHSLTDIMCLATATPLQTSPSDLFNFGRMLCLPKFQTRETDELEREMKRALAKAIKDISPEQRAMYAERLIRGVTDEKNDPTQQYNA
ncbi:hypothetical protein BD410DRAFT_847004, partial [Rickenella mellea]